MNPRWTLCLLFIFSPLFATELSEPPDATVVLPALLDQIAAEERVAIHYIQVFPDSLGAYFRGRLDGLRLAEAIIRAELNKYAEPPLVLPPEESK